MLGLKQYCIFITLILCVSTSHAADFAENLYTGYKEVLYQIKIIDNESGQKSTIGSGFIINGQGLAVTNYHVVSDFILYPDKNRIEVEDIDGKVSQASLVNFDVINDLALIRIQGDALRSKYLPIAAQLPTQGSTIYSLGNPHDLGMIVVPGTYNGLKQNSFYQKIHFTGSVNSGMSGGPVVNESGEAMGVNVATAGNQLGFLVPLSKLKALINKNETIEIDDYKKTIAEQLQQNQQQLIAELTAVQWPKTPLGMADVPDAMADFITCWGGSNADDKEAQYLAVRKSCSLDQTIYISRRMQTGRVAANFEWYSSDKLNGFRFYNMIDEQMRMMTYQDGSSKEDFSEYQCQRDVIKNVNNVKFKSSICVKNYKEFDGLFDVLFVSATLDQSNASLVSRFYLSGISQASYKAFTPVFMDAISWQ